MRLMDVEDYWDSYWIMLGLLKSELYEVASGVLQNFMDEVERFGFIPNGGRIYCMFFHRFCSSKYL
jgi:neutral trehalase